MIINFQGSNYCDQLNKLRPGYCGSKWKTHLSTGNSNFFKVNNWEKFCTVASFVLLFINRILFYKSAKHKDNMIDMEHCTPNDYTLEVKGLPPSMTSEQITQRFSRLQNGRPVQVEKVNLAYRIGDFVQALQAKNVNERNIRMELKKKTSNSSKIMTWKQNIQKAERTLQVVKNKFENPSSSGIFTGRCYITYKYQKDAENVLDEWEIGFLGKVSLSYLPFLANCYKGQANRIGGKVPIVEEPPEPLDILWENLGTSVFTKYKLRFVTSFITLFMLGCSFGFILLLKYAQVKYFKNRPNADQTDGFTRTMLSLAITGCISFVNMILGPLIRVISSKEKYGTVTRYNISVAKRVAMVQFLNTSVIIVFVNWLIYGKELRTTIWENKGLSNDAWFIMLGNIVFPPLTSYLNPWVLIRKMKRSSIAKQGRNSIVTQKEANMWFEAPPFDIAQKYANNLKTVMISIFFMPMFPLALPAGIVAIIFARAMEKYLLLRRYAAPKATGAKLNFALYRFFDLVILIFGVSSSNLIIIFNYSRSHSGRSIIFSG